MSNKALSVGHNRFGPWSGCFLRGFFGIFFIAGALAFYFLTFRPLWGVYSAQQWVETPCTILSSEVETHDSDEGSDTYSIEITYRYEHDGQKYTGDRYHFMNFGSSSGRRGKQEVVKAHPPGRQTVCYVDPDDPEEAVIQRGLTADMWWGLFPLPFLAVGLGGLLFGGRLTGGDQVDAAEKGDSGDGTQTTSFVNDTADDGPVTLKAEWSPVGVFVASLVFGLIWNGIISMFVYDVVQGHLRGRANWFMTVFMIPFVLIGLALLVWIVYAFMALFNPRPTVRLSRGRIPLGGQARLSWRFRGNSNAIVHLKLTLEGEEKATYRRGTDTHTDTETFYEQVVFESDQPYSIASGEADVEIPADSMHTFKADSNEIIWSLHFAGDIPLRPDVNESFPIHVTPHDRSRR